MIDVLFRITDLELFLMYQTNVSDLFLPEEPVDEIDFQLHCQYIDMFSSIIFLYFILRYGICMIYWTDFGVRIRDLIEMT